MTLSRMLAACLAVAAIAAPSASAVTPPPDLHTLGLQHQRQDLRSPDTRDAAQGLRSPGHPSHQVSVPPAEAVSTDSGGSSVDWTPIVFAAGLGLMAICGVGLVASRRRQRAVV